MGYSVSDVMEFVEENDVKFVKLAFTDIYGNQKNINIVSSELRRAFKEGIKINATNIDGFGEHINTDLLLRPDPDTMNILPWRPSQGSVLRFYCDILKIDGTPYEMDCRYLLKKTLEKCKEHGITFKAGVRSEFYLFKLDEDGEPTNIPIDKGTYLDVSPYDKGENVRRDIVLTLGEMGIEAEKSFHQKGPGQNEIDFKESDSLSTADNYTTFKNVVRVVSARNGMHASFLPKPIPEKSGNSLQLVFSVYRDGNNLYEAEKDKMEQFVAGILNRMPELTAILNTHETSYLRFGKHEAPEFIAWSTKNLGQLIKMPTEDETKRRCILRSPDSFINPYLAMAAVAEAGILGMINNEALVEPLDAEHISHSELEKNCKHLPKNLSEAINETSKSEFLKEAFGEVFIDRYLRALKDR